MMDSAKQFRMNHYFDLNLFNVYALIETHKFEKSLADIFENPDFEDTKSPLC